MSMVFGKDSMTRKYPHGHATVQKLLDENASLLQTIFDCQNSNRFQDAAEYQQTLHRNLVYLANLSDDAKNLLNELQIPPDPTPTGQNVPTSATVLTTLASSRPPDAQQADRQTPGDQNRLQTSHVPALASGAAQPQAPVYYNNVEGQSQQVQPLYQQIPVATSRMGPPQPVMQPQQQGQVAAPYGQAPVSQQQQAQYWQYQHQQTTAATSAINQQQATFQQVQYGVQQRPQTNVSTANDVYYTTGGVQQQQRYQHPVAGAQQQQQQMNVTYQQQHGQMYGGIQQTISSRPNPNYPMVPQQISQQQQPTELQPQQQQPIYNASYHVGMQQMQPQQYQQQQPPPQAQPYQQP